MFFWSLLLIGKSKKERLPCLKSAHRDQFFKYIKQDITILLKANIWLFFMFFWCAILVTQKKVQNSIMSRTYFSSFLELHLNENQLHLMNEDRGNY